MEGISMYEPKKKLTLIQILHNSLDPIAKILTIFITTIPLMGYIITNGYLSRIKQSSLFTDILSFATNLLLIGITFSFIPIIITFVISIPFLALLLAEIPTTKKIRHYQRKNTKLGSVLNVISLFLFVFLSASTFCSIYLGIENDFVFLINLFLSFVIILLYSISSCVNRTIKQQKDSLISLTLLSAYFSILTLNNSPKIFNLISFTMLHSYRYIETLEDSSWYLLHNNFQQNNGSQETNGIDKNDLLKLKQKFKCSALSETERKRIECSPHFEQRNNALYGYMAWNLGDTKVFCPPTVNNTIGDKEQKEKLGKECVIISGKALQIMPESYISTNTDGIDDGNTENTGHDDPAIDINTDVRFKNDLNVQSNTGLTNYNIQPVLPIQSNAKNMSIQIHYGSCNHDSPRNKDGHPDIGYTDKKICQ